VESNTPKSFTRNEPCHWTLTDGAVVTGISGDVDVTPSIGVGDPEAGPGTGVVFVDSAVVVAVVAIVGAGSVTGVCAVGQSHATIAIRAEINPAIEPAIAQRSALPMISPDAEAAT